MNFRFGDVDLPIFAPDGNGIFNIHWIVDAETVGDDHQSGFLGSEARRFPNLLHARPPFTVELVRRNGHGSKCRIDAKWVKHFHKSLLF